MATANLNGGTGRDLTKYRIIIALSLAVLAGSAAIYWHAYRTHVEFLNAGNVVVRDAIMAGELPEQEGAR